ncbi:Choline-sulfatase [Posidoniimonas polymericola]|uniref:Choline-sulfatase n=1 Tax=Posidoniimonas polymericola TaxID=2528002 RepID=A0A5C5ZF69_9BACT|nr:sulfatase [Posidoniimonas polymericola]TWT86024.1 Choline-sulfatase [Posidoniimonas polymericola]
MPARILLSLFALTVLCPAWGVAAEPAPSKRPNILFIFSDDHAPHAIGAYNGWLKSVDPTPNIDRLAQQGMLFENSFCTNSICGPSRAVILTGKHSHINGFMNNGNRFDGGQPTLPKYLRAAGYQTALYGKWHLKSRPQGFDDWKILSGQGLYYNPDFQTPDGRVTVQGYCTDIVTDMAVDWMTNQRDADKPFLLMCQHKAPHRNWMPPPRYLNLYDGVTIPEPDTLFDQWTDNASPARAQEMEVDRHMDLACDLFVGLTPDYQAPADGKSRDQSAAVNLKRFTPEQLAAWNAAWGPKDEEFRRQNPQGKDLVRWKYQRYAKNYLRCVRTVDDSVARLMQTLDELGIADNTIVVYSSDQGFYIGDHGWYDKRWMYEESLKMPLIVKWPGVAKPGSRDRHLVQNLDYAETFLDAAGVKIPADMQGRSLAPLLRGETPNNWRDAIYYHFYEYPGVHMTARHYGIRDQRYKLIYFYQQDEWEFYDLEQDPDELTNAYGDPRYAQQIADMKQRLTQLREHYGDGTGDAPPITTAANF